MTLSCSVACTDEIESLFRSAQTKTRGRFTTEEGIASLFCSLSCPLNIPPYASGNNRHATRRLFSLHIFEPRVQLHVDPGAESSKGHARSACNHTDMMPIQQPKGFLHAQSQMCSQSIRIPISLFRIERQMSNIQ